MWRWVSVPKRPGTRSRVPLLQRTRWAGSTACPGLSCCAAHRDGEPRAHRGSRARSRSRCGVPATGMNGPPRRARSTRLSWDPWVAFPMDLGLPGHRTRGSRRHEPPPRAAPPRSVRVLFAKGDARPERGRAAGTGSGSGQGWARLASPFLRPGPVCRARARAAAGPVQLFC